MSGAVEWRVGMTLAIDAGLTEDALLHQWLRGDSPTHRTTTYSLDLIYGSAYECHAHCAESPMKHFAADGFDLWETPEPRLVRAHPFLLLRTAATPYCDPT